MSKRRIKHTPPPAVAPGGRSRRTIVAALVLIAVAGTAAALWFTRRPSPPAFVTTADQNVLLITIDTLRGDALGAYGGRAATPHLDRLAAEGVRFTFAHAHAVVTLPSHTSILSGRYPYEHGVRDNAGYRVAESVTTLAEMARDKGFATGAFVGAFPLNRDFGLDQGFGVYDDLSGRDVAPSDFAFSERPATEVVESARRWISEQRTAWFAWVHVFDPHSPYAAPEPFAAQYPGDPYAGEVAATDAALGPLLDRARGSGRPTTIIVTADHGEGLGDHQEATHGIFAYESTLRVPLIVAQVGAQAGDTAPGTGVVSDVPVRHVDIVPTIAGLTGMTTAADLPGRTLLTAVNGDNAERPSYFEAMTAMLKRGWAPLRGVIVGREKYIDLPIEELYDLESDPGESQNLVPKAPDRVRTLAAHLEALDAVLPGEQVDENAEVRARLQALGYLSGSAPRKAVYTEADDPKRLIDVDTLMIDGIELHRAGRSAEAMDAYRRVIARRPDMGLAYRRLAYIQWEVGAVGEAIETLRQASARIGPDVEIETRLGTYLAETGSVTEAIPMLERTTRAVPDDAEAANALGIAYARAGRDRDAIAMFERILAKDPRSGRALANLGTVYLQQQNFEAARDAFTRAIAVAPSSSRAHAGLGVVASAAGRTDEAIGHWQRAVERDGRNFDAVFNLASALIATGRTAEARPIVQQFVSTAPPGLYGREIAEFRGWLAERTERGRGPGEPVQR